MEGPASLHAVALDSRNRESFPRRPQESYWRLPEAGERAMMAEVLARGPITCSMATPETFDYWHVQPAPDLLPSS